MSYNHLNIWAKSVSHDCRPIFLYVHSYLQWLVLCLVCFWVFTHSLPLTVPVGQSLIFFFYTSHTVVSINRVAWIIVSVCPWIIYIHSLGVLNIVEIVNIDNFFWRCSMNNEVILAYFNSRLSAGSFQNSEIHYWNLPKALWPDKVYKYRWIL